MTAPARVFAAVMAERRERSEGLDFFPTPPWANGNIWCSIGWGDANEDGVRWVIAAPSRPAGRVSFTNATAPSFEPMRPVIKL